MQAFAFRLFHLLLSKIPKKIKFAAVFKKILLTLFMLHSSLLVLGQHFSQMAFVWYTLAQFTTQVFVWSLAEFCMRYQSSKDVSKVLSMANVFNELAIVVSLVVISTFKIYRPEFLHIISAICLIGLLIINSYRFLPMRFKEIEVRTEKSGQKKSTLHKRLLWAFALLFSVFGFVKFGSEYLVTMALKEEIQSYEARTAIIYKFNLLISLAIIVINSLLYFWSKKRRVTPLNYLIIYSLAVLAIVSFNIYNPFLISFIALDIIQRSFKKTFFEFATNILFSYFTRAKRIILKSKQVLYYSSISMTTTTVFFTLINAFEYDIKIEIGLAMIMSLTMIGIYLIHNLKNKLKDYFSNENSTDQYELVSSFLGECAISKQKDSTKILKLMDICHSGSDQLRLLEEAYKDNSQNALALSQNGFFELNIDEQKELIQLAVNFRENEIYDWVTSIALGNLKGNVHLSVRIFAFNILIKKQSHISQDLLIKALQDSDERVVSHILELIPSTKNQNLLRMASEFIGHEIPRISANACLSGLLLDDTRFYTIRFIRDKLHKIETSSPSYFFICGRSRNPLFIKDLLKVHHKGISNFSVQRVLYWSLAEFNQFEGFYEFASLFQEHHSLEESSILLHLMLTWRDITKERFLRHIQKRQDLKSIVEVILNALYSSKLNHYELTSQLEGMMESTLLKNVA